MTTGAIISLSLTALSLIAGIWRFFSIRNARKRAQAEERNKANEEILDSIEKVNNARDLIERDSSALKRLRNRFYRD